MMADEVDMLVLTMNDLQTISSLDSRQFGFIKLNSIEEENANSGRKCIALKAIRYLERIVVTSFQNRSKFFDKGSRTTTELNPKIFCKLGHLHLLMEDYTKALSAYQRYFALDPNYWKDSSFLYGLGLVYFQFNAFRWATKAFQQVLYIDPGFSRANEVRLRLGLIAKINGEFEIGLKYFKLTQFDSSPCSLSKQMLSFHIAHLHEVCGYHKLAKELYCSLLTTHEELPAQIKADVYRQLGWMHHSIEMLESNKNKRIMMAIDYLQKSIDADPKSGRSLYLLGRCYASIGKVHEAFISYRNSVDKSESNADTWCSIGVLYQQQNQPMDALQAYICAVQLNKDHAPAWTNLGILYESTLQPHDALACYVNSSLKRQPSPALSQRIKYLRVQLNSSHSPQPPSQSVNKLTKQLPIVEEAWNTPISNEMNSRQAGHAARSSSSGGLGMKTAANGASPDIKRIKMDPNLSSDPQHAFNATVNQQPEQQLPAVPKPAFYLNQQQLQSLQYLQSQPNLGPQQQQILQHLQHQFRLMQQHQLRQQHQIQQINALREAAANPTTTATSATSLTSSHFISNINMNLKTELPEISSTVQTSHSETTDVFMDLQNKDFGGVSDRELEALISEQDIGSFAERLLKQIQADEGSNNQLLDENIDVKVVDDDDSKANGDVSPSSLLNINNNNVSPKMMKEVEEKLLDDDETEISGVAWKDIPTCLENIRNMKPTDIELTNRMSGEQIVSACSANLAPMNPCRPPVPAPRPSVKLTKEQLLPPTPSVYLENKKDAFSSQLQEFCLQHPIAVVRGIASVLKMDLGLFSTKTLLECYPNQPIETMTQRKQTVEENWDDNLTKQVWECTSIRGKSTIMKFAQYQVSTFQESLRDECTATSTSTNISGSSSFNHNRFETFEEGSSTRSSKKFPMLKFASAIDISDQSRWRAQLAELKKLPSWVRDISPGNMLSHIGYPIVGMNTVHLSMMVPCSRILAHQEDNNFCAINLNIGPGDCEWFGVPYEYWGAMQNLCEKFDVNFIRDSWWPNLRDLKEDEVPVYRFLQRPGDLVWVNTGCVHWVQAVGWCNNISWNVGPMTFRQYSLSLERYEWNILKSHKSLVAMTFLSWRLARNVRISDKKMFDALQYTLRRSLRQIVLTTNLVKSKGVDIKRHGRSRNEPAHYCNQCDVEVFGVIFVREFEGKHVVHCVHCAQRHNIDLKGSICLSEVSISELVDLYNSFRLQISSEPSSTTPPLPLPMLSAAAVTVTRDKTPSTCSLSRSTPKYSSFPVGTTLDIATAASTFQRNQIMTSDSGTTSNGITVVSATSSIALPTAANGKCYPMLPT